MFIFSEEIVLLFLGNKWLNVITIFRFLIFYSMIRSVMNPIGYLILAKGKVEKGFYWNLFLLLFSPIFIVIGSGWGLSGIVIGLLAGILVFNLLGWYFLVRALCGATFVEYYVPFLLSGLIAVLCIGPMVVVNSLMFKIIFGFIGLLIYLGFNKDDFNIFRGVS